MCGRAMAGFADVLNDVFPATQALLDDKSRLRTAGIADDYSPSMAG